MARTDTPRTSPRARAATSDSLGDRASARFEELRSSASDQVVATPLIALVGGIAVGALIAAILPQADRESALLEPVGSKVTDATRNAIDKVREASKAKVDELAGDKVRDFLGMGGSSAA